MIPEKRQDNRTEQMLRKPWPIKKGLAALGSFDVVGASVSEIAVDGWGVC